MNLKRWAERDGVCHVAAYRWFREGRLPVPARKIGRLILVGVSGSTEPVTESVVVYARVSSADQRADLDRQVARVTGWATGQGLVVSRVVTEVGSALDGHRKEFLALLREASVITSVVEHRGRFARFGAEYVEAVLAAQGRRLLVVDHAEVDDDLVRDVTEILTSLYASCGGEPCPPCGSGRHRRGRALMAARKVVVRCNGCARTQTLRPSKIEPCDGYYCTPGHGPKDEQPPGLVREQIINAAGGFWGWRDVVPTQEDMDAIARARAMMALGQAKQIVDEAVGGVA